jgi:hypothetical protein
MNDDELSQARQRLSEITEWIEQERLRLAFHESGHAVARYFFGDRVQLVSIRPGATYSGVAVSKQSRRRKHKSPSLGNAMFPPLWPVATRRVIEKQAICALAGPAAEFRRFEFTGEMPQSGFYQPHEDEVLAERLLADASLSSDEQELLARTEASSEPNPRDLDTALDCSRVLAGPRVAAAQFAFCKALAAELVYSDRFTRLAIPLVEELLAHDVVGGERTHELFEQHDNPEYHSE